ncbi:MAG: hypothetical protein KF781_07800 [Chitinophagaceae bacterium]|nr:hypothetical protein [Chitinophagaceae bacterium]MCW5905659.1 hypothetical protein [Chitinophagaceae bacterium]
MKILHIHTYDYGGAATVCMRIHLGLLQKGVPSKLLLLDKIKNIPHAYGFLQYNRSLLIKAYDKIESRIISELNKSKMKKFNRSQHVSKILYYRPYLFRSPYVWGREQKLPVSRQLKLWELYHNFFLLQNSKNKRKIKQTLFLLKNAVLFPMLLKYKLFWKKNSSY